MTEYIDRTAIKWHDEEFEEQCHNDRWTEVVTIAYKNEVDKIPTADVRPVVLCKDCTHSRKGKESVECEKHRYAWNDRLRWVDDNDFCCWGVRKDGDGKVGLTEKSFLERMEYMGFYDSNKYDRLLAENDALRDVRPVKRGRWLPTKDDNKKRCSNCDVIHLIAQYPHGEANYCPNCGARMDGDGDV